MMKGIFGNYGAKIKENNMRCYIRGELVDTKTIEDLGFQGGRHAKAVEYEGKEYIIVRLSGGAWTQHVPSLQFGAGYKGQCL